MLLLTGWAAHRYRHNQSALPGLRLGALVTLLATVYFALVRPLLRRISDSRLARLIEEHTPGTDDRLVAAVEYSGAERDARVSAAIVNRLYSDANRLAATLTLGNVIRRSRLLMYGAAAALSLLVFLGVLKWGPR